MSAAEIDQYLGALEEPKRTTLAGLRQTILDILPEAEQGISYGLPAFKVRGKTIAGFAAFKNHLSYLPHSGSVFPQLKDELKGYSTSTGALRPSAISARIACTAPSLAATGWRLAAAGAVAIRQPGKACWSRTAISFSTSGTGRGWSIPKRRAPDEVE